MYNNSHNLFNLKGVEEGHVPLTRHFKCDIEVGGQVVHRVGILIKKDKVPLVDSKGRNARTPALLGSNLISPALNEFCEVFSEECICLFECPVGISLLRFSTLCLYYYAHIAKKAGVGASSVSSNPSNDKDKEGNNPNPPKTKGSGSQNTTTTKQNKAKAHKISLIKRNKVSHIKRKSIPLPVMLVESWLAIKDSLSVFQRVCLEW